MKATRVATFAILVALGAGLIFAGCGSSAGSNGTTSAQAQRQATRQEARQRARLRHEARAAARRAAARRRAREAHRAAIRQQHREEAEARATVAAEEREEAESSECDPNYAGACLDPYASDYDCEGGSGNGPDYTGTVSVVGEDHYGLDADGDGTGCDP